MLAEQYNISGFIDSSASPSTSAYDFRGTFETKVLDTSGIGIFVVSASNY